MIKKNYLLGLLSLSFLLINSCRSEHELNSMTRENLMYIYNTENVVKVGEDVYITRMSDGSVHLVNASIPSGQSHCVINTHSTLFNGFDVPTDTEYKLTGGRGETDTRLIIPTKRTIKSDD